MTGFATALYQHLPFPVLIVDAQAHVVSYNDAAARTFGWSRDGQTPTLAPVIDGPDAAALLTAADADMYADKLSKESKG